MAEKSQRRDQQAKVLRIGIVRDKKLVEERLIRHGENVTIGQSDRNTFEIASTKLPKRHTLFMAKGDRYFLNFTEPMAGKVAYKKGIVGLKELRQQGEATRKGGAFVLPLQEKNRGKVVIDDVTVLFQFVPAPPESARMIGKQDFRPKLLDEDDPVFLGFLALFSAMAAVLMIYVYNTEPVLTVSLDQIPDRFADVVIPPSEPKDIPETEVVEDPNGEAVKKEVKPEETAAEKKPKKEMSEAEKKAAEAARKEKKKQDVLKKSKLLAGIIGTRGENNSGGQVEDVFADGDGSFQNLQDALQDVGGIDIASGSTIAERGSTDGGGRGDASIGDLAGAQGGDAAVGAGPATKAPKGKAIAGKVDAPVDADMATQLRSTVRRYGAQVQSCYEQRLKENPNIEGRLAIEVVVGAGRVSGVSIDQNTTGDSGLEACVIGKVKRWRFPAELSETVVLPFSLSSG